MIKKTILDSGLIIISEEIPSFPSFALSYSLKNGSRSEDDINNGIHHLVEHMIFKGSEKFNLKQIADISDRLGGRLNAFTGKETTQFYIKAIDEKFIDSFELLTDITMNSLFPEEDFEKERNVILQEIKESDDNPDTYAFESYYESLFKNNGIALPIAGKVPQVSQFKRDEVYNFYKKSYTPDQLLLAAVGNLKHDQLVELANDTFSGFPSKAPESFSFKPPEFNFQSSVRSNSSLKQLYVLMGFKSIPTTSPQKYDMMIMNDILGSGMSSRLFQEIRENKGLAYTISSFLDSYLDTGIHLVYSIVEPSKLESYLMAVQDEIRKLKTDGITIEELNRAKDHLKSSIILTLESTISKMRFNVNQELFLNKETYMKEISALIDQIDSEDIHRLTNKYLDFNHFSTFVYGDIGKNIFEKISFS